MGLQGSHNCELEIILFPLYRQSWNFLNSCHKNHLGLFSKMSAVVELPTAGFFLIERNLGRKVGVVIEGLSPDDLRLKSPSCKRRKHQLKKQKNRKQSSDSTKSKIDGFSKIINWVILENKQHHRNVLQNSFPINGHTLGLCPSKVRKLCITQSWNKRHSCYDVVWNLYWKNHSQ